MIKIYIVVFILCIILGVVMGYAVRRDRQRTQCPYCSCRDCCNIGYGIIAACSDTEQKSFVCMK